MEEKINKLRRIILKRTWKVILAIATAELLYMLYSFFAKENKEDTHEQWFNAGHVSRFKPGSITPFISRHFFLTCLAEDNFLALSSRCTHLGCRLNVDTSKNELQCPCHASAFNARGEVLHPPAMRNLIRFEVKIENDSVFVKTSND